MFLDVKQCGHAAFFLTFLGVTGFVASLFAILLAVLDARASGRGGRGSGTKIAFVLGPATVALGIFTIAMGFAATARGRRTVDAILASGSVAPAEVDTLRTQGYAEVRTCTAIGVQSGTMPLCAGVVATAIALARSRRRSPPASPS